MWTARRSPWKPAALDILKRCQSDAHLVELRLATGEGEREAQRQLPVLDPQLLQEVGETLGDVVKQLTEASG